MSLTNKSSTEHRDELQQTYKNESSYLKAYAFDMQATVSQHFRTFSDSMKKAVSDLKLCDESHGKWVLESKLQSLRWEMWAYVESLWPTGITAASGHIKHIHNLANMIDNTEDSILEEVQKQQKKEWYQDDVDQTMSELETRKKYFTKNKDTGVLTLTQATNKPRIDEVFGDLIQEWEIGKIDYSKLPISSNIRKIMESAIWWPICFVKKWKDSQWNATYIVLDQHGNTCDQRALIREWVKFTPPSVLRQQWYTQEQELIAEQQKMKEDQRTWRESLREDMKSIQALKEDHTWKYIVETIPEWLAWALEAAGFEVYKEFLTLSEKKLNQHIDRAKELDRDLDGEPITTNRLWSGKMMEIHFINDLGAPMDEAFMDYEEDGMSLALWNLLDGKASIWNNVWLHHIYNTLWAKYEGWYESDYKTYLTTRVTKLRKQHENKGKVESVFDQTTETNEEAEVYTQRWVHIYALEQFKRMVENMKSVEWSALELYNDDDEEEFAAMLQHIDNSIYSLDAGSDISLQDVKQRIFAPLWKMWKRYQKDNRFVPDDNRWPKINVQIAAITDATENDQVIAPIRALWEMTSLWSNTHTSFLAEEIDDTLVLDSTYKEYLANIDKKMWEELPTELVEKISTLNPWDEDTLKKILQDNDILPTNKANQDRMYSWLWLQTQDKIVKDLMKRLRAFQETVDREMPSEAKMKLDDQRTLAQLKQKSSLSDTDMRDMQVLQFKLSDDFDYSDTVDKAKKWLIAGGFADMVRGAVAPYLAKNSTSIWWENSKIYKDIVWRGVFDFADGNAQAIQMAVPAFLELAITAVVAIVSIPETFGWSIPAATASMGATLARFWYTGARTLNFVKRIAQVRQMATLGVTRWSLQLMINNILHFDADKNGKAYAEELLKNTVMHGAIATGLSFRASAQAKNISNVWLRAFAIEEWIMNVWDMAVNRWVGKDLMTTEEMTQNILLWLLMEWLPAVKRVIFKEWRKFEVTKKDGSKEVVAQKDVSKKMKKYVETQNLKSPLDIKYDDIDRHKIALADARKKLKNAKKELSRLGNVEITDGQWSKIDTSNKVRDLETEVKNLENDVKYLEERDEILEKELLDLQREYMKNNTQNDMQQATQDIKTDIIKESNASIPPKQNNPFDFDRWLDGVGIDAVWSPSRMSKWLKNLRDRLSREPKNKTEAKKVMDDIEKNADDMPPGMLNNVYIYVVEFFAAFPKAITQKMRNLKNKILNRMSPENKSWMDIQCRTRYIDSFVKVRHLLWGTDTTQLPKSIHDLKFSDHVTNEKSYKKMVKAMQKDLKMAWQTTADGKTIGVDGIIWPDTEYALTAYIKKQKKIAVITEAHAKRKRKVETEWTAKREKVLAEKNNKETKTWSPEYIAKQKKLIDDAIEVGDEVKFRELVSGLWKNRSKMWWENMLDTLKSTGKEYKKEIADGIRLIKENIWKNNALVLEWIKKLVKNLWKSWVILYNILIPVSGGSWTVFLLWLLKVEFATRWPMYKWLMELYEKVTAVDKTKTKPKKKVTIDAKTWNAEYITGNRKSLDDTEQDVLATYMRDNNINDGKFFLTDVQQKNAYTLIKDGHNPSKIKAYIDAQYKRNIEQWKYREELAEWVSLVSDMTISSRNHPLYYLMRNDIQEKWDIINIQRMLWLIENGVFDGNTLKKLKEFLNDVPVNEKQAMDLMQLPLSSQNPQEVISRAYKLWLRLGKNVFWPIWATVKAWIDNIRNMFPNNAGVQKSVDMLENRVVSNEGAVLKERVKVNKSFTKKVEDRLWSLYLSNKNRGILQKENVDHLVGASDLLSQIDDMYLTPSMRVIKEFNADLYAKNIRNDVEYRLRIQQVQKEIGMSKKEQDGVLWEKTLFELNKYIESEVPLSLRNTNEAWVDYSALPKWKEVFTDFEEVNIDIKVSRELIATKPQSIDEAMTVVEKLSYIFGKHVAWPSIQYYKDISVWLKNIEINFPDLGLKKKYQDLKKYISEKIAAWRNSDLKILKEEPTTLAEAKVVLMDADTKMDEAYAVAASHADVIVDVLSKITHLMYKFPWAKELWLKIKNRILWLKNGLILDSRLNKYQKEVVNKLRDLNLGKEKSTFPSQKYSIDTERTLPRGIDEHLIYNLIWSQHLDRYLNDLFDFIVALNPELKNINATLPWAKYNIIRWVESRFNVCDIKFFVEETLWNWSASIDNDHLLRMKKLDLSPWFVISKESLDFLEWKTNEIPRTVKNDFEIGNLKHKEKSSLLNRMKKSYEIWWEGYEKYIDHNSSKNVRLANLKIEIDNYTGLLNDWLLSESEIREVKKHIYNLKKVSKAISSKWDLIITARKR